MTRSRPRAVPGRRPPAAREPCSPSSTSKSWRSRPPSARSRPARRSSRAGSTAINRSSDGIRSCPGQPPGRPARLVARLRRITNPHPRRTRSAPSSACATTRSCTQPAPRRLRHGRAQRHQSTPCRRHRGHRRVRGGYGNAIVIDHGHSLATLYGHPSQIWSSPVSLVKRGDLSPWSARPGLSTGPHLHFETASRASRSTPRASSTSTPRSTSPTTGTDHSAGPESGSGVAGGGGDRRRCRAYLK